MKDYFEKPVYIVVNRIGEDINDDDIMRTILGIYSTEEDAVCRKELEERRAEKAGFGDCNKFYVESWLVHKPM